MLERAGTIEILDSVALRAADRLIRDLTSAVTIEATIKSDRSIVTEIDLNLNEFIQAELKGSRPIVSEETPDTHSLLATCDDLWLVDPLDGTSTCRRFRTSGGTDVGFGPIVASLKSGRIEACSFYHVPCRTLFTAIQGGGTWWVELQNPAVRPPPFSERQRLPSVGAPTLQECLVLFYPGSSGELRLVERLQSQKLVEDLNTFSGFANHCTRLARGLEQIQFQFSVGPWDYAAALLMSEVGLRVMVDPLGKRIMFDQWTPQRNNPILAYPPSVEAELLKVLDSLR